MRQEVLHKKNTSNSGQTELFDSAVETPKEGALLSTRYESERDAQERILEILKSRKRIKYDDIVFEILQMPLISERLLKVWLKKMRDDGVIDMEEITSRQSPKGNTIISFKE